MSTRICSKCGYEQYFCERSAVFCLTRGNDMLEVMNKESTWQPPKISQNDLIDIFNNNTNHNIRQGEHFIIFKMSPYIDSVYVSYDEDKISIIKRFTFAEGPYPIVTCFRSYL